MSPNKMLLAGLGALAIASAGGPTSGSANENGESGKGNGGIIVDTRKVKVPRDANVIIEGDTANGGSNVGNGGRTGHGNANGGSGNGNGGIIIDRRTVERNAGGKQGGVGGTPPNGKKFTLPWGGTIIIPGRHADGESNVGNGQDGIVIGKGSAKAGQHNGQPGVGIDGGSARGGHGNGNGGVVIDPRKASAARGQSDDSED
jgi:hypothetical protein